MAFNKTKAWEELERYIELSDRIDSLEDAALDVAGSLVSAPMGPVTKALAAFGAQRLIQERRLKKAGVKGDDLQRLLASGDRRSPKLFYDKDTVDL